MAQQAGNRASRRVPVSIPVGYFQQGRAPGVGNIIQLSAGGCLLTETNLDVDGPEVFLHFSLGGEHGEVHLRGRVVHCHIEEGTGLEFVAVSPEGRDLLRQYVRGIIAGSKRANQEAF